MRKKITSSSKQTDETGLGSEAGFRYLIQNTSDIITILEYDGSVRYANPAAERVLGYPPGEQIGANAFGSVHPNDRERAMSIFAELVDKPGIHGPIEFMSPARRWLLVLSRTRRQQPAR